MKKLLIIQAIITTFVFAQSGKLTLEESLRIGLTNSKEIKVSQSKVIGSETQVSEVGSQMLPKLSFGASYVKLSDVPPFEVVVPISPTPIKIQDAILNNYSLRLSLQQPLFTGFRLSSTKSAAELNYKAAGIEHTREVNKVALKIQTAFWNYYKAQNALKLVNENLKSLKQHLADTKAFMDNGLVTRNDYLKLQVQVSNVELLIIETKNGVNLARAAFNKAIGYPLKSETEISAGGLSGIMQSLNYDELLNEALKMREELQSISYKVEAGKDGVRAANAGWFPSVFLFGNYYYNRPNQRIMPAKDQFEDTWDVGVSLSWDLWNWGYTSSKVTQAEQRLVQSQTNLEMIKEGVEIEVYQNYLKLQSEYDKIKITNKT
ncbi:TolC family protein, partial [Bacteroidota bacterium]